MRVIGYAFAKLRTEKDLVRKASKNALFRGPFGKQHYKRSQTLFISAQQHF